MKKILSALMVFCTAFALTGCKGKMKDLDEQLVKLDDKIEEGNIFNKDYKMIVEYIIKSGNNNPDQKNTIHIQRDGKSIYVYYSVNGQNTRVWVGEKEEKYYIFVNDGVKKEYSEIEESDVGSRIQAVIGASNSLTFFEESIKETNNVLLQLANKCSNEEEGVTCAIDKSLFGEKLNFKVEQKITQSTKTTIEVDFKEGNIKKTKLIREDGGSETYKYDYGNQSISLPAFAEYTKK